LEILNTSQRRKLDESNDFEFYSSPKFVYHLDSNFRKELTNIYSKEICSDSTVLDLMSSWDSYLPTTKNYKKVIGHGLNKKELEKNKYFDKYWIQNFNIDQNIPLESESIDYCLLVAAWQYLQYPENIAMEIARILKGNGKLIIAFSNRAFWTKAPNIWTNSDENQRVDYVRNVLISNGFDEPRVIKKFVSNNLRILPFFNFDPFYCLISQKKGNS
tara:strand:+ start:599 stop:1246 length:648 start_codon:yes stop_codon:yes gene_type:complete